MLKGDLRLGAANALSKCGVVLAEYASAIWSSAIFDVGVKRSEIFLVYILTERERGSGRSIGDLEENLELPLVDVVGIAGVVLD